jgi:hypothetical protein
MGRWGSSIEWKTAVVVSNSPTPESVEADLIDALTYEDDQWLWEPVWVLKNKHPDLPEAAKVGLADQRRVTLWRGQWPGGIVEPLSEADRDRIAVEEAPWSDPESTDLLVIIQIASKLA